MKYLPLVALLACSPEEPCVPPSGQGFLQLTLVGDVEGAASYSVPLTWSACGEELGGGLQTGRIASWVVPAGVLDVVAEDGEWGATADGAGGQAGCHGAMTVNVPGGGDSTAEELVLTCED